jgi:hypothetical protein
MVTPACRQRRTTGTDSVGRMLHRGFQGFQSLGLRPNGERDDQLFDPILVDYDGAARR